MDMDNFEARASLVCIADGAVSIYIGNDSAIIGLGEQDIIMNAAKICLKKAETIYNLMNEFDPNLDFHTGGVKFHVFTYGENHSEHANEVALEESKHFLSDLYYCANDLITKIRLLHEKNP